VDNQIRDSKTYILDFILEVLCVIAVLHQHHYVFLIFEVVVEFDYILMLEHVLDNAFLLRLPQLVLTEQFVFLYHLFDDILQWITFVIGCGGTYLFFVSTCSVDEGDDGGGQPHLVDLFHLLKLGEASVLTRIELDVEHLAPPQLRRGV
jgi:hypothetical protein